MRRLGPVLIGCALLPAIVTAQTAVLRSDSSLQQRRVNYEDARADRFGAQRVPAGIHLRMPRVSGLSVSTNTTGPNGAGYDVEIDVQMTTTRSYSPTWSAFSPYYFRGVPDRARLGDNLTTFSYAALPTPYPLTGNTARIFFATTPNVTNATINTDFTGYIFNNIASGQLDPFIIRTYLSAQLPLPGVSYGDGDTASNLTLTQPSNTQTATTSGGLRSVSRRWRASLSHTYSDSGSYTVRVASACCSPDVITDSPSPGRGTAATTGTLIFGDNALSFVLEGSGDFRAAAGGFNATSEGFSNTQTTNTTLVASGPFSTVLGSFGFSSTTFPGTDLDQVTASAIAMPGVLQVPTSGALGLAVLALLLVGVGIFILRS